MSRGRVSSLAGRGGRAPPLDPGTSGRRDRSAGTRVRANSVTTTSATVFHGRTFAELANRVSLHLEGAKQPDGAPLSPRASKACCEDLDDEMLRVSPHSFHGCATRV